MPMGKGCRARPELSNGIVKSDFVVQLLTYVCYQFQDCIAYPALIYNAVKHLAFIYPAVLYLGLLYPVVKYPAIIYPTVIYSAIISPAAIYPVPTYLQVSHLTRRDNLGGESPKSCYRNE